MTCPECHDNHVRVSRLGDSTLYQCTNCGYWSSDDKDFVK
jgi:uncharacterized Zn finger protein